VPGQIYAPALRRPAGGGGVSASHEAEEAGSSGSRSPPAPTSASCPWPRTSDGTPSITSSRLSPRQTGRSAVRLDNWRGRCSITVSLRAGAATRSRGERFVMVNGRSRQARVDRLGPRSRHRGGERGRARPARGLQALPRGRRGGDEHRPPRLRRGRSPGRARRDDHGRRPGDHRGARGRRRALRPTARELPSEEDLAKPVEERPIGGLGLMLAKDASTSSATSACASGTKRVRGPAPPTPSRRVRERMLSRLASGPSCC